MSDSKTIILNGNKVWFGVIGAVLIQTASIVWFSSSLNTTVKTMDTKLDKLVSTVDKNRDEAKEDTKDLRKEFYQYIGMKHVA